MSRVLVVDDDPTVSDVVSRYLTRDGHDVEVVNDGLLALTAATANLPDLMVLDLMLPPCRASRCAVEFGNSAQSRSSC